MSADFSDFADSECEIASQALSNQFGRLQSGYCGVVACTAISLIALVIGVKTNPVLNFPVDVLAITLASLFPMGLVVLLMARRSTQRAVLLCLLLTGLWCAIIVRSMIQAS